MDVKAKRCQKQMNVKNQVAVNQADVTQQMDVTAHGCHRKRVSKINGCHRQRDVTVNSCRPFVFPRAKYWENIHKLTSAIWHMIAQHMRSAKGLKEAKCAGVQSKKT